MLSRNIGTPKPIRVEEGHQRLRRSGVEGGHQMLRLLGIRSWVEGRRAGGTRAGAQADAPTQRCGE